MLRERSNYLEPLRTPGTIASKNLIISLSDASSRSRGSSRWRRCGLTRLGGERVKDLLERRLVQGEVRQPKTFLLLCEIPHEIRKVCLVEISHAPACCGPVPL